MQNANQGRDDVPDALLDGSRLSIGIVQARFNSDITRTLAQGCLAELRSLGVTQDNIRLVTVPGALEIPVALQALAESDELVANESGAGVTRVGLDNTLPIANAILTVETEAQAWDRADEKGRDAARVAVEMANLLDTLA
jgi:6,7-dimethyl-8-ribityllumazine synthase